MRWRGNKLKTKQRHYTFNEPITSCSKVMSSVVVVFKSKIVFIEKDGEIITHHTREIRSSGFLRRNVIYVEKGSNTIMFLSHPYEVPRREKKEISFTIASAYRNRYVLYYPEYNSLEIYKYKGTESTMIYCYEMEEQPLGMIVRHNRLVIIEDKSFIFNTLKVLKGGKRYLKRATRVPHDRIISIVPFKQRHGLYLLVNGYMVIDENGIIFKIANCTKEEANEFISRKAIIQIEDMSRGYIMHEMTNIFRYATRGQKLFSKCLPWRMHSYILRARIDQSISDLLFTETIRRLTPHELRRTAYNLEYYIHMTKNTSKIQSFLFGVMSEMLLNSSPRHAYLFNLLSLHPDPCVFSYELVQCNTKLIDKSPAIGYTLIRNDKYGVEAKESKEKNIPSVYTLDDTEYIREVSPELAPTSILEECKELLSGKQVGDFVFDEFDTENRRRKAFIFQSIVTVGRGIFLLNQNQNVNVLQIPRLKVLVKKNSNVVAISTLNDQDKLWPSFHNAVAVGLSIPNRPFISTAHLEVVTPKALMCLGGSIFGLGLKEALSPNRLTLGEKHSLTKALLLTLSRSHDSTLIASTILGNAFILKRTSDKRMANICLFNLSVKESSSILLMWSALALGVSFMGSNDIFCRQALMEYIDRRGVIQNPNDHSPRKQYYDKYHRVAGTLALSYISLGSIHKEYIRLSDRTCELIINGIHHMGTGMEKIALLLRESSPRATPLNRFYSQLAQTIVMGVPDYEKAFQKVLQARRIEDAYAVAGQIFGQGIVHIPALDKRPDEEFVNQITFLLYMLERTKSIPSIVMDYTLLATCLVLNSTGDLRALGTCRRLLGILKNISSLEKITDYSPNAYEYREQYGMRYGRIQHIKMCISLLVPSCGTMKIDPTQESIALIISSFYADMPLTPEDQDAFQVLRHFYTLSFAKIPYLRPKQVPGGSLSSLKAPGVQPVETEANEEYIPSMDQLLNEYTPVDLKISLDIISTFFENNKTRTIHPQIIETLVQSLHESLDYQQREYANTW
ncbi:hypothetical protein NEOKW01_1194 [Nematocida sp. AWRm80]|nr:hypothetical protein NEOKW01_1194 [Nematocida sp. AWRm80]